MCCVFILTSHYYYLPCTTDIDDVVVDMLGLLWLWLSCLWYC